MGTVVSATVPAALAGTTTIAADQVDLASFRRDFVMRLALRDAMPEVRAEAWNALRDSAGEAALVDFLAVGYPNAKTRAAQRIDRNYRYVKRVNDFSLPGSAVRATSAVALVDTPAAQAEYVQGGYARAQELDRVNNNKYEERLARMAGEDHAYVAELAANDPGTQVRAAASRALSVGDETAIGLFFKYHWGIGADLDDEAFRRATSDQNDIWHSKIRSLTEAALAAEKAERDSSGELARKWRADAIAAWRQIEGQADQSSVDWSAEKVNADRQAANWATVAQHARTAQTEQDWAAVLGRADRRNASWADEAEWALQQAATWRSIAAQARVNALAAVDRDQGDD
ncbi:hypothetical protein [Lentzea sp.]|uniref:hypothetical protein n=1 Tax=Lentzea sp. TaxID=56099 RepID=UPI002CDD14E8|nr:hypothetical protein [Lentzea sp.]HUQ56807.1 hypothetical protein [Lentzea sp.]